MKLVVFAHTPQPYHGQSYMVQLMLEGFGGNRRGFRIRVRDQSGDAPVAADGEDRGLTCYHVNARLSRELEDIGVFRPGKFFLLLGYCFQAIWCRLRYGAKALYYIPAPAKHSALYRDWLVMALCRPFFPKLILHWHAVGLGAWLEKEASPFTRWLSHRLLRGAELSIVLLKDNVADAEKFLPKRTAVVGNGIPDPCPKFESEVLPLRRARSAARKKLLAGQALSASERAATGGEPHIFKVLYLAHCTREKGLFDAVEAALLANQQLRQRSAPLRLQLHVAGQFMSAHEKAEFERRLAQSDFQAANAEAREFGRAQSGPGSPPFDAIVQYHGFVSGDAKRRLLEECSCFCFPSHGESFGLVLAEAMAFGMAIVVARWPGVHEILAVGSEVADIGAPDQLAAALLRQMDREPFEISRRHFNGHFNLPEHWKKLSAALHSVEQPARLLVVELWGLGDLAIASRFIEAVSRQYEVTLVAKPYALDLQRRFWPKVKVVTFQAPWTAFRGKYRLWAWPWRGMFQLIRQLRAQKFDIGVSARWDPRDHFLLRFFGSRQRIGFSRIGSHLFLSRSLELPQHDQHAYERWRLIAGTLGLELPSRDAAADSDVNISRKVLVHSGAALPVRVWPLERYQRLVRRLREADFNVQVACDVNQEGWWRERGETAVVAPKNVTELLDMVQRAGAFIGNDSGPGHVAAVCGLPTLTIFGPQLPELFAPVHPRAEWLEGKPCPYKPCSDYCRFPEPHCLFNVTEEEVWQRAREFLNRQSGRRGVELAVTA